MAKTAKTNIEFLLVKAEVKGERLQKGNEGSELIDTV